MYTLLLEPLPVKFMQIAEGRGVWPIVPKWRERIIFRLKKCMSNIYLGGYF